MTPRSPVGFVKLSLSTFQSTISYAYKMTISTTIASPQMIQSAVADISQQVSEYLTEMGLESEPSEKIMQVSWSQL
jgi:hypothetical protein